MSTEHLVWPDYPVWFWVVFGLLSLFAVVTALIVWRDRRGRTPGMKFPAERRLKGVNPGWKVRLVHLPLALRFGAILLGLLALTRPQLTEAETAEVEGIDIVVAFDFSGSMAMVDITDAELADLLSRGEAPQDRFAIATDVMRDFVKSRKYDRISLVAFGKQAFLMFPLTLDYAVMLRILDQMALDDIDGSATAIGNALAMSLARLKESEAKTRLVILLTDGEDNGSNVSPLEMAKEAARQKVHVFPILVGTDDQSRQPTGRVDMFTQQPVYQKVTSPVNPALLEEIAQVTDGTFYRATDKKKLAEDFQDILDRFEKSRLVDLAAAERTEAFHWALFPALLLLFLEVLLSQTVLRRFP
ncbi:MAG: VWA domain-containing protein [Bradymonadia bacterium]